MQKGVFKTNTPLFYNGLCGNFASENIESKQNIDYSGSLSRSVLHLFFFSQNGIGKG